MKRLTILDTHEAQNITTVVNELKSHWIFRDHNALYTLGAAAYLDAPTEDTLKKFSLRVEKQQTKKTFVTLLGTAVLCFQKDLPK